jgi:hypothetical protein
MITYNRLNYSDETLRELFRAIVKPRIIEEKDAESSSPGQKFRNGFQGSGRKQFL